MKENIFKLLGDENRLRMVILLLDRELCMTHIYIGLDLKQSNTSRNLKILSDNDFVSVRNKKNNRYYKISDDYMRQYPEIFAYLNKIRNDEKYLKDVERMKAVENCGCGESCECKL